MIDPKRIYDSLEYFKTVCNEMWSNEVESKMCTKCPLRTASGNRCMFEIGMRPFEWTLNDIPKDWRAIK